VRKGDHRAVAVIRTIMFGTRNSLAPVAQTLWLPPVFVAFLFFLAQFTVNYLGDSFV
jgi:hypothetical protein